MCRPSTCLEKFANSTDTADLIAEIHEDRAENQAAEAFRNHSALLIALLAGVLAVGGLGGGNATDDMVQNNIKASNFWAFYQAKNVRQTMYGIDAGELKAALAAGTVAAAERPAAEVRLKEYEATVARYESEPDPNDPSKGEGKKELSAQAKAYEAAFEEASRRDNNFDFAEVLLQIALVLGSVAILAVNRWIRGLAIAFGIAGALLTANGFLLLV